MLCYSDLKGFYRIYRSLEEQSRWARYDCWMPTEDEVSSAISDELDPIREKLKPLLTAE